MEANDIDDGLSPQGASPEADAQVNCGYSGERAPRSEMFLLDGCWIALAHQEAAVAFTREGGRLPRVRLESASAGCLKIGHVLRRTRKVLSTGGLSACALFLLVNTVGYVLIMFATLLRCPYVGSLFLLFLVKGLAASGATFLLCQHARGLCPGLRQGLPAAFRLCGSIMVGEAALMVLAAAPIFAPLWLVGLGDPENMGLLMLAMIIPCFYLLTRWVLAVPASADERKGGLQALVLSWRLTRGRFWRTFLMASVPSLAVLMSTRLFSSWARLVSRKPLVIMSAASALQMLLIPLMAFVVCFYVEMRAMRGSGKVGND